jgi:hypothetical protein
MMKLWKNINFKNLQKQKKIAIKKIKIKFTRNKPMEDEIVNIK